MSDDEVVPYDATEYGIQLCRAVKSNKCLYDRSVKATKAATTAAWKAVAKRCNDQVTNCRFRWKTLRNNFTRSYKKFGDKSNYYLYPHLLFLIPHLDIPPDDDSFNVTIDEVNKSPPKTHKQNISHYSDSETTLCADGSQKTSASLVLQNETNETLLDKQQPINTVQRKDLNENTIEQPRHVEFKLNETPEESNTLQPESPSSERRLRDRKLPKRYMDEDLSPEIGNEKRPRRVLPRRKSVGGLALKELEYEKTLPDFPHTPPDNEDVIKPKPTYPYMLSRILSYNLDDKSEMQDNHAHVQSFSHDDSALENKKMVDSFTNTEKSGQMVSVGIQCDIESRGPDDEFLESLKLDWSIMNRRQKVHFKRRVYHSLMDVLDDSTNFPTDNEIIEAASAVAADFKSTTSSELTLIRELVALVQAAKCTPEFKEIGRNKAPESSKVVSTSSSSATIAQLATSPLQAAQNVEKQTTSSGGVIYKMMPVSPLKLAEQTSIVSTPMPASSIATTTSPMIIKRQFMPKAIEIAGAKGSTVLTQDGETRRIIRVYPSNALMKSLPSTASPGGTQASTTNATLPSTSQQRTQTSTTYNSLPSTSQQRTQPSTTSASLPSTRQQRIQPFTPPQRTQPCTPPQRTLQNTTNGTLSSSHQQRPQPSTTNANLLSTSQQKTQPHLVQIPNSSTTSGLKMPPLRSNASTTKYNPYLTFVANRDRNASNNKSMLPPSPNMTAAATNVMSPAHGNGVNKTNTMSVANGNGVNITNTTSPAHGSGVNKPNTMPTSQANSAALRGPTKIISRRYSLCGPVPAKNQPISTQNRITNLPYKRVVRTPPPLQKIPNLPKRDEFNLLLQQLPPHVISQSLTASTSTVTSPALSISPKMQLSSPVSLNTACNSFNQNQPTKYIPAINYNCRPRMSEPPPQPVNFEADPMAEKNDPEDYLTPSEASLLEMAGTVAADNFGSIFDGKTIKNEPEEY